MTSRWVRREKWPWEPHGEGEESKSLDTVLWFPGWCLLTTQLLLPCWHSWLKPSFNSCWIQTTNALPHPPSSLLIQQPTPTLWRRSSHTQLAPWKAYWSLTQHPNPWDLRVSRESKATATLHTQCCPSVASSLPLEPLSWGVSSHICLLHSHLCLSLSLPTVLWGLERETFSCIISSSATFAFMEKNIFSILSRKRPYESASANLNI